MPQTFTMCSSSTSSPNSKASRKHASYNKQRSLGNSRKRVYRRQQSACIVDQFPSRIHTSTSSITSVRKALASFESSLNALSGPSGYFRSTSASLVLQLKQLLDSEELLGDLHDDNIDGIASNTDQSSEESLSTSGVVDSEYPTDNTSVSSFSKQLSDDASPTASRSTKTPECLPKSPQSFPCTFAGCERSFKAFSDWKRHEETHYPQEHFICLHCIEPAFHSNGNAICGFCKTVFGPLSNLEAHYLYCQSAQQTGKTFARRDKMTAHLREYHSIESTAAKSLSEDWKYPIHSDWPRQCNFCEKVFQTWEERLLHLADHFKPRGDRPSKHFKYHKDNDSDDDDDDFSDDHPSSRQKSSGGKTLSSTTYGNVSQQQQAFDRPNNISWGQSNYNSDAPTTYSRVQNCPEDNSEGPECRWATKEKLASRRNEMSPLVQCAFKCHFKPCSYGSETYSDCIQHIKDAHTSDYFLSQNDGKNRKKPNGTSAISDSEPPQPTNTQVQSIDENRILTLYEDDNSSKDVGNPSTSQDNQMCSSARMTSTSAQSIENGPLEFKTPRKLSFPLERWLSDGNHDPGAEDVTASQDTRSDFKIRVSSFNDVETILDRGKGSCFIHNPKDSMGLKFKLSTKSLPKTPSQEKNIRDCDERRKEPPIMGPRDILSVSRQIGRFYEPLHEQCDIYPSSKVQYPPPKHFYNMPMDVQSLHALLEGVKDALPVHTPSAFQRDTLKTVLHDCTYVLKNLRELVDTYEGYGRGSRRTCWRTEKNLIVLRARMKVNVRKLNILTRISPVLAEKQLTRHRLQIDGLISSVNPVCITSVGQWATNMQPESFIVTSANGLKAPINTSTFSEADQMPLGGYLDSVSKDSSSNDKALVIGTMKFDTDSFWRCRNCGGCLELFVPQKRHFLSFPCNCHYTL